MRTLGFHAINTPPDLGIFRKIAANERVRMWCNAAAAGASVIATLGKLQLCNTPIAIVTVAAQDPNQFFIPAFDYVNSIPNGGGVDAELFLSFSFGGTTVNFILGVDP